MLEGNTDVCMRKVMEITRSLVFLCFLLDFVRLACEYGHLSSTLLSSGVFRKLVSTTKSDERWLCAEATTQYVSFFFSNIVLNLFFFFANDSIGRFGK